MSDEGRNTMSIKVSMALFMASLVLGAALADASSFKSLGQSDNLQPYWSVYFSPYGGCAGAIIGAIDGAKSTVLVQAYSFTSRTIAQALIAAHKRGVAVEIIVDTETWKDPHSEAKVIARAGIPISTDAAHTVAHNKVMVIDNQTVITGSFNFTTAAEFHNAENLLIIHDPALAARYTDNWRKHRQHSEVYK